MSDSITVVNMILSFSFFLKAMKQVYSIAKKHTKSPGPKLIEQGESLRFNQWNHSFSTISFFLLYKTKEINSFVAK